MTSAPNPQPTDDARAQTGWATAEHLVFASRCVLLLACVGWPLWFFPFDDLLDRSGTPLGGDYVMLYTAGTQFNTSGARRIYDDELNQQLTAKLVPSMDANESWPYRYPPTVAAVMSWLARLSFAASFAIFCGIQFCLLGIATYSLRQCSTLLKHNSSYLWPVLACPVVIETFIGGQASLLALACATSAALLLVRDKPILAGVVLAVALYKPNVLGLFIVGCAVARPRLLIGFVPTALLGLVATGMTCGWESILQYLELARQLSSTQWLCETPLEKVHGLAPWVQAMWPAGGKRVCLVLGLAAAVTVGLLMRRDRSRSYCALAGLLVINSVLNPYVPIYDLVLLLPAVFLFGEYALTKEQRVALKSNGRLSTAGVKFDHTERVVGGLLGLMMVGPHISQSLALLSGFQFFPILLCFVAAYLLGTANTLKPAGPAQCIEPELNAG